MSVKFKVPIEVDGKVSAEYLDLSTTTTRVVDAGEIAWNSIDGTFDIGLLNGVTLQAGQEMHFYGKATEAISNGNAVMFAGVQGDHILIAKADAATINANPEYFMGVATQDFTTNQFGYVTSFGNVRGLNTLSYTLGDVLYFDSTSATDGLLTATEPSAPNAKIIVAAVVRVHATQGILAVRPHTMPKLKDIQDVNVDTATTGEILQLQSTGVWENKTLSEAGIISGTGTTNYLSKFTGSTTLGNSLLFDNGTNVGIGTTSPTTLLDVRGGFNVSDGTSTVRIVNSGGVGLIGTLTTHPLAIRTDNTERMRITSAGNVGIGTTSPAVKLHLLSSSENEVRVQESTNNAFISLYQQATTSYLIAGRTGSTPTQDLSIYTGGGEKMRILSTGNVGIGTSAPNAKLEVSAGQSFINQDYLLGWNVAGSSTLRAYIIGTSGNELQFWNRQGGTNTQAITLNASGNVGIGTTAPGARLDVVGIFDALPARILRQATYGEILRIGRNGVSESASINYPADGVFAINTVSTERMRITSSGNVGIGTTAPSQKLELIGNAVFRSTQRIDINTAQPAVVGVLAGSSIGTYGNFSLISSSGTAGESMDISYWNSTTYLPAFRIANVSSGFSNLLLMKDGGNVGIGTANPNAKLEVYDGDISVTTANSFSFLNSNRNFIPNTGGVSLGALRFRGYSTGTTYQAGAAVYSFSQDTWTSTSAPGYLSLQTTSAGSTSPSEKMVISSAGAVRFNSYGSGTFTGTATQKLAVDSSGNIIEIPIGAGPVDGSGTTNYVTKWTDADTIGNSIMYDNGTNVGIGTATTSGRLTLSNPISDGSIPLISIRDTSNVYEVGYLSFSQSTDIMTLMNKQSYSSSGIVFGTNNAEKMRITVAGNVGIGTSSPLTKLHVAGGYLRLESSGDKQLDFVGSGKNTYSIEHDTARIYFYNGSTGGVPLAILNGGNVGIGTANPATRFQVSESGSAFYVGNAYAKVENTAGSSSTFYLADTTDSAALKNIGSSLAFINSSSEGMRLTTTGLGIGTTSPNYKLDVNGTVNIVGTFGGRGVEGAYRLKLADNGGTANDSGIGMDGYAGGGEQMWFNSLDGFYWATGTYGEKMRITQAGNVGIGTSAPNFKLEVNGSVHVGNSSASASGYSNAMEIVNTASSPTSLFLYQLGVGSGHIGLRSNDSNLYIVNSYTDGSITNPSAITLTSAGSVGIGTSSPGTINSVSFAGVGLHVKFGNQGRAILEGVDQGELLINDIGASANQRIKAITSDGGKLFLGAYDDNGTARRQLTIDNSGNVGIGTTAPNARLDVQQSVDGNAPVIFANSSTGTSARNSISLGNNTGTISSIDLYGSNYNIGSTDDVANGLRILNSGAGGVAIRASNASGSIRSYIGSSEVMRVASNSNVGIGTSAPSIKFQVETSVNGSDGIWARNTNTGTSAFGSINCVSGVGAINLRAYSAAHTAWPSTSMINSASAFTGGMALFQDGANPISLWTNGSERMRVTSAGNIGIGTTSPSGRLHVVGTSPSVFVDTSNTFAVSIGAASATPNIVAIGTSGSGIPQIQGYTTGFGATANLSLQPNGANVGIGTTSADSRLHISSTASNLLRMVRTGGTATNFGFELGSGAIGLYNYSTSTYGWYLGSTGNLGIGTTSPGAKLDVEAATTGYAAIIKNTTAGGDYLKMTGDSGNTAFEFGSGGTGADAFLNMYADNTQKVLVNADGNSYFNGGNVGIGTTSPVQKLDVSGSIKASGSVQVGDDSTIASATNVGATRYRSDANNSYMDMVMQTGASTYAWVNVVQNNW